MPIVRAQCELPMVWGASEDIIVNTLHFDVPAIDGPTLTTISDALASAYNFLEPHVSAHVPAGPVGTVTYYNLAQPTPRPPIQTDSLAFSRVHTNGITALPHEVAICLSYESPHVAGVNQQRHRGRIYFGPLDEGDNAEGRPSTLLMQAVQGFGRNLLNASQANPTWSWIVYSRVQNTGAAVIGGWVDNEFDTQRRRGVAADAKFNWDSTGIDLPASVQRRARVLFKSP